MKFLIESIRKTADIADGWTVGRLVNEAKAASIQKDDGSIIPVPDGCRLEVWNGDQWQELTGADLAKMTVEGWPAYAGLDARMKEV